MELRTERAWDITASLLIGQEAHVVRFYAVLDGNDPQNAVLAVFDTDLQLIDPQALFHQFPAPEGSDTPPDGDLFPGFPTLRWDTYVGIGNLESSGGDDTDTFPDFVMGADFLLGGWFNADPPNMQGAPDQDNAVFLGQWTLFGLPKNTQTRLPPGIDLISPHVFGELTVGYGSSTGSMNTRVQIAAQTDCNGNSTPDLDDLSGGTSLDQNFNNIPDECDPCMCGDLDGDDFVTLSDFGVFSGCFGVIQVGPFCNELQFRCSDMNEDLVINLADFSTFAVVFLSHATNSTPNCGN